MQLECTVLLMFYGYLLENDAMVKYILELVCPQPIKIINYFLFHFFFSNKYHKVL